ncbi:hypothetical protein BWI15_16665 [Kribbella sp. ALI-6-A]|uniref:hypothetical protein n=1 Tax=Kribbella sp. ALI-6-A TaxID=1933817 RepID=UPI00097C97B3|nr:hypothetical protein [Kribbella sp. ALI-6-A]ONI71769.1 hypothetical protein BWI15_16665 [Kribbella sp. ALI-6-A]
MSDVATSFRRDWNRLWELAEKLSATPGRPEMFADCDAATIFGFAGLFLEPPSNPGDWYEYVNSPRNAITFASTGGDGTHFCALFGPADAATTPVILSVPLADEPNRVVGASLPEFLALGCVTGYHLDDLAYDTRDRMLHELQTCERPTTRTALTSSLPWSRSSTWLRGPMSRRVSTNWPTSTPGTSSGTRIRADHLWPDGVALRGRTSTTDQGRRTGPAEAGSSVGWVRCGRLVGGGRPPGRCSWPDPPDLPAASGRRGGDLVE